VELRVPKIFNLRSDPFERADHNAIYYNDWLTHRIFLLVPAQVYVAHWIASFKDFPPSQTPASFSVDQVMKKLAMASGTNRWSSRAMAALGVAVAHPPRSPATRACRPSRKSTVTASGKPAPLRAALAVRPGRLRRVAGPVRVRSPSQQHVGIEEE